VNNWIVFGIIIGVIGAWAIIAIAFGVIMLKHINNDHD
jgi:hypothetical protein